MSESCNHDCGSCSADCASRTESFRAEQNEHSNVKKVIGVVSGKGGVGKSLVTSLLAVSARRRGYETAILDADITGPSIPKAFNVHTQLMGTDDGVIPAQSRTGIRVVSLNLLLENETDPRRLARPDHRRHGQAVLDGRHVGATWTTCSSTCLRERATCPSPSSSPCRWTGVILVTSPAGAGRDDRQKGRPHGGDDERARARSGGEHVAASSATSAARCTTSLAPAMPRTSPRIWASPSARACPSTPSSPPPAIRA